MSTENIQFTDEEFSMIRKGLTRLMEPGIEGLRIRGIINQSARTEQELDQLIDELRKEERHYQDQIEEKVIELQAKLVRFKRSQNLAAISTSN